MRARVAGQRGNARRVEHFVLGAHRLAITSQSLADLLGLGEGECRTVLEAMSTTGMLYRVVLESGIHMYCKE